MRRFKPYIVFSAAFLAGLIALFSAANVSRADYTLLDLSSVATTTQIGWSVDGGSFCGSPDLHHYPLLFLGYTAAPVVSGTILSVQYLDEPSGEEGYNTGRVFIYPNASSALQVDTDAYGANTWLFIAGAWGSGNHTQTSTAHTIPTGSSVWFQGLPSGNGSRCFYYKGSGSLTTSTYEYVSYFYPNFSTPIKLTAAGSPTPEVAFSFPQNGTTTPDFSNWSIDIAYPTTTIEYVEVLYGRSTTTLWYYDEAQYALGVSANPLPIPKSQPLLFPPLASGVEWFAEAILLDSGRNPLASTTINFYVSAPGGETSSTIANPGTTCDYSFASSSVSEILGVDLEAIVINAVCKAGVFLFIPNSAEQQDIGAMFSAAGSRISTKPPIGYLTVAATALTNFTPTSSTSTQLLTASGTVALAPALVPLDQGLALIISLVLILWIYNRTRHFEP